MISAVASLSEKRPNNVYDYMPEQMREKRFKSGELPIVDSAMKLPIVARCCVLCRYYTDHEDTDHDDSNCPNRSKMMAMACNECIEPCEIKEHKDKWDFRRIVCFRCGGAGDHWSKDCPDPFFDECDFDWGDWD
ncbi:hypothetical protein POM88_053760 [Heracleum sosnowskyi]|uniref:CCHC-type domain-containing protein n=1 Tax=Heracleum sosnowskyi TaxID=360622 RepID=A0AAD8GQ30_9APIA|nr:hypothetical protein POM88_053760 [Heracleum sosnowskyi]